MKQCYIAKIVPVLFLFSAIAAQLAGQVTEKLDIPLGLDAYMPIPEDNPLTRKKVALGRELFADPRLSRDQTVSCATCHDPNRLFTDDLAVAVGVFERKGTRRTPTIVNRGYGKAFFWDGRIVGLEQQVVQPILAEKEMDMTLEEVVVRLKRVPGYRENFQEVFHREINADDLGRALASYARTILSGDSPYDRYMKGNRRALSKQARRGLRVFQSKGNCVVCHVGQNLTDEDFHNTGVAWRDGRLLDEGRFIVTGKEEDRGAFKTPTLRDVALRAPYMHDGSLATLEEVVEFYDRGGNRNPYVDSGLVPLKLTDEEKRSLVAFLHSLKGKIREGVETIKTTSVGGSHR